ncbi:MAG: hypothetical protein FWG35_07965, partial [Spirochaetaceae bacterium]|nr:hypothetical protein [Spirochaetaceae bacterium]
GGRLDLSLPAGRWFWRAYEPSAPDAAIEGVVSLVYAPPPRLLAPHDNEVFRSRSSSFAVDFRWTAGTESAGEGAAYYFLEAADNPAISNPAFRVQISGTSAALRLPAGQWYWRVTPVYSGFSGSAAPSQTSSFSLEEGLPEAPVLISPEEGASIDTAAGSRNAFFSWRRTGEAPRYTIFISQNADMSAPRISRQLSGNYYAYDPGETPLAAGRYYWAVAEGTGENAVLSDVRSFTAETNLSTVTAVFPPDGYSVADILVPELRFSWKVSRRGPVRFQLSRDAGFAGFVVDEEASGGGFRCENLAPAVYYWRVAGAEDKTPARRIIVEPRLLSPEVAEIGQNGVLSLKRGEESVVFSWNAVEGADYYRFRLHEGDANGAQLFTAEVETESLRVDLRDYTEGAYTWTVQAFSEESSMGSRRTGLLSGQQFEFRHSGAPPPQQRPAPPPPARLPAPEGRKPSSGYVVGPDELRANRSITFNWLAVPRATAYIFSLYEDSGSGRRLLTRTDPLAETSYVFRDLAKLGRGNFVWTVQAVRKTAAGADEYGISAEGLFTIDLPKLEQNVLPEVGDLYGR